MLKYTRTSIFDRKKVFILNNQNSSKASGFLKGAFILTISTAFVKIAGLLFTLPIANMLGGEGMGYFYSAYDIYNMLAVLASAGLPVAVSRMVSETLVSGNTDEAERIYTVSSRLFTVIGAVIGVLMFFGADVLADIIDNPNAALSIRVLAVTAFCAFVMSSLRGYFQGKNNMLHTAVSQTIEAFAKLVFGFILAAVLVKTELSYIGGSAGAIMGVSIGAVLSVVYLSIIRRKHKKSFSPSGLKVRTDKEIIKELFRIAVPVSLGASVMSLVNLIDTAVIMRILQNKIGYTYEYSNWLYGVFGNAKKIFNFPSAFIVPFTVSILPVLTAAFTAKDSDGVKKNMVNVFKYSNMLALPAGVGIFVLAEPIMNIIYFNIPEEANAGAPLLAVFGFAVMLYAAVSVTGSVLQSFGKVNLPLISLSVGAAIKCGLNFLLVGIPEINIMGAPIATVACYVVMITMNLIFLRKYLVGCREIIPNTLKTVLASAVMGVAAYFSYKPLSSALGIKLGGACAIVCGVVVYAVMIFALRIVTVKELKGMLRKG